VIVQMWEGMPLEITEQAITGFPWSMPYNTFPDDCCGAGKGIWERLVPDYIRIPHLIPCSLTRKIKISPACWLHDLEYESGTTWDDFHAANSRLYANIKTIILKHTEPESAAQYFALRSPAIYAQAVDTLGRKIFWAIKQEQGHTVPRSAAWLL